ncbi:MAG: (Fe-S)-binding protein [Syntrophobacterales bacterium]|nr:(Fe-S)-binding protein [Syntrophobacterales bacterium]
MKITDEQIAYCMECGVCTGSCPVARHYEEFSPRSIIKQLLIDREDVVTRDRIIWRCVTCARCSIRCPALIDIPQIVNRCRSEARKAGYYPEPSHHGVFHIIPRLQLRDFLQDRVGWASQWRVRRQGEYFYFVGCAPYFSSMFRYLQIRPLNISRAILTLLNAVGIEPVVSNREVCCGHDALWTGEEETFVKLAQKNVEAIRRSGAEVVIFSCPEGYITFKHHYTEALGKLPFQVIYASEFFMERIDLLKRLLSRDGEELERVTYHDPCRLGRLEGIYDSPRILLDAVPGVERMEMERSRENALCCGTSAWIECSSCSKSIQFDRLEEASDTMALDGSEEGGILITSCPKCYIHLNCARAALPEDRVAKKLQIEDIYVFLARHVTEIQDK